MTDRIEPMVTVAVISSFSLAFSHWVRRGARVGGLALLMAIPGMAALPTATQAQPVTDPDWPCAQRLVPELAAATLWQGAELKTAQQLPIDDDVRALAGKLVDDATSLDEAAGLIKTEAGKGQPDQRADRLQALFLAVIDAANGQRSGMIQGIKNFGRRQRALADRINGESRKIRDLQAQGTQDAESELQDLTQQHQWDMRIFDERQHTIRIACDQPVQVEQRSFALGRLIAAAAKADGR
jgi:hypothetical protein